MKAITLNLLVEEQLALQAKARDPVKVTIVIGIVLITIAVLSGSWLAGVSLKRKSEADSLQSKCDALTAKQGGDDVVDMKTLRAMSDEYVAISHARFLFGPDLAVIKDLVPPTIQISSLRLALQSDAPSARSTDGDSAQAHPKTKVDTVVLQIEGHALCQRAELEVDQFIQAIQTNEVSRSIIGDVKLKTISSSGGDIPGGPPPTATFTIDCTFRGRDPS